MPENTTTIRRFENGDRPTTCYRGHGIPMDKPRWSDGKMYSCEEHLPAEYREPIPEKVPKAEPTPKPEPKREVPPTPAAPSAPPAPAATPKPQAPSPEPAASQVPTGKATIQLMNVEVGPAIIAALLKGIGGKVDYGYVSFSHPDFGRVKAELGSYQREGEASEDLMNRVLTTVESSYRQAIKLHHDASRS